MVGPPVKNGSKLKVVVKIQIGLDLVKIKMTIVFNICNVAGKSLALAEGDRL
jgi:hypothetical protein